MCVICIKPKGVEMPCEAYLENMWYGNPDGAGFMYADGKKVVIDKGYMTFKSFRDALDDLAKKHDLKDLPLVMHFRIGTAGGNIPANTHPFPISDSIAVLQKLHCTTKLGIVHNGIIPITPRQKDISDTMEYIASQLSPLFRYDPKFYRSKELLQMIGNATTSKLAFMNENGEIYTVGAFNEDRGCLYSNYSYASSYIYRRVPVGRCSLPYQYNYADDYEDAWSLGGGATMADDLMLLDEGQYVVDRDTGDFYEADDMILFMDCVGFLYGYDDLLQACVELTGWMTVYNSDGSTCRFDPDKAMPMLIDEDASMPFREYAEFEGYTITEVAEKEDKHAEQTGPITADEDKKDDEKPF